MRFQPLQRVAYLKVYSAEIAALKGSLLLKLFKYLINLIVMTSRMRVKKGVT